MNPSNNLNLILLRTLRSVSGAGLSAEQEKKIEALSNWALLELMQKKDQAIEPISKEFLKLESALSMHVGDAKKVSMSSDKKEVEHSALEPAAVGEMFSGQQMCAFFALRAPCLVEYPDGDEGAIVLVLPSGKVYGVGGSEPLCDLKQLEQSDTLSYPMQLSNMFKGNIEALGEPRADEFLRYYQESARYVVENQMWQQEQAQELEKELGVLFGEKKQPKKGIKA